MARLFRYSWADNGDGTYVQIAELELLDAPAGTDLTSAGGTITASSDDGTNTAANAIDNDNATVWVSAANDTYTGWIQAELADGTEVGAYSLRNATTNTARMPTKWELSVSDDGGSTWTILDNQSGVSWSSGERKEYTINKTYAARGYELEISQPQVNITDENLSANSDGLSGTVGVARIISPQRTGKYIFRMEFVRTGASGGVFAPGISRLAANESQYLGSNIHGVSYFNSGRVRYNGLLELSTATYPVGSLIDVAVDLDAAKIWFAVDRTWINSGDPAAGTGNVSTWPGGGTYFPSVALFGAGCEGFLHPIPDADIPAGFSRWPLTYLPFVEQNRFFKFDTAASNPSITFSDNDITASGAGASFVAALTDLPMKTGQVQFEFHQRGYKAASGDVVLGIMPANNTDNATFVGDAPINGAGYQSNGDAWRDDVQTVGAGAAWQSNAYAVITITLDFDTLTAEFYLDGVSQFTYTLAADTVYAPAWSGRNGTQSTLITNTDGFYFPVAGFRALGDLSSIDVTINSEAVTPILLDPSQLPADFFTESTAIGDNVFLSVKDSAERLPVQALDFDTVGETCEIWSGNAGLDTLLELHYGSGLGLTPSSDVWLRSGDADTSVSNYRFFPGEIASSFGDKPADATENYIADLSDLSSNWPPSTTGLNGIGFAGAMPGSSNGTVFIDSVYVGGAAADFSIFAVMLQPSSDTFYTLGGNFAADRLNVQHFSASDEVKVYLDFSGQDRNFTVSGITQAQWESGNWFIGISQNFSANTIRVHVNDQVTATQTAFTADIQLRRMFMYGSSYRTITLDHIGLFKYSMTQAYMDGWRGMLLEPSNYATYGDAPSGDVEAADFSTAWALAAAESVTAGVTEAASFDAVWSLTAPEVATGTVVEAAAFISNWLISAPEVVSNNAAETAGFSAAWSASAVETITDNTFEAAAFVSGWVIAATESVSNNQFEPAGLVAVWAIEAVEVVSNDATENAGFVVNWVLAAPDALSDNVAEAAAFDIVWSLTAPEVATGNVVEAAAFGSVWQISATEIASDNADESAAFAAAWLLTATEVVSDSIVEPAAFGAAWLMTANEAVTDGATETAPFGTAWLIAAPETMSDNFNESAAFDTLWSLTAGDEQSDQYFYQNISRPGAVLAADDKQFALTE